MTPEKIAARYEVLDRRMMRQIHSAREAQAKIDRAADRYVEIDRESRILKAKEEGTPYSEADVKEYSASWEHSARSSFQDWMA